MRRALILFIALAALGIIAAASATAAAARPRGTNGKILINRADNSATGEEQTFTVDPDGTDFTLLANNSPRCFSGVPTGRLTTPGSRARASGSPIRT
jgi:hypothetical protein